MFERFTQRARRVIVLAQEEARMIGHNYIGTEHILLGLVHEGEGVAAKALESLGVSLTQVRDQVVQIIGRGGGVPAGHIPFTPRAKKVLELSLREARQLGHNYIGGEHILLGLVREGEGVAAQVLVQLGAGLDRVRATVVALLAGYVDPGLESPPAPTPVLPPRPAGPSEHLVVAPFSQRAVTVLGAAADMAHHRGAAAIEPFDILIGLLGTPDGEVDINLETLGTRVADARFLAETLMGRMAPEEQEEAGPESDEAQAAQPEETAPP